MNNKKERAVVDKSNNYFTQSFLKILNKLYFTIMHVEDLSKLARFKHLGDLYYECFYFNETLSITELQQLKNKIKNSEKKFSYEEISIIKGIVRENMYDELIENKKILMYMNIFGELPELCEKCNRFVENEAYLKHKENCKKDNNALCVIKNEIIESKTIIKDKQFLEGNKETQQEDIITEEYTQIASCEKISIEVENKKKNSIKEQIPKHKKETTLHDEETENLKTNQEEQSFAESIQFDLLEAKAKHQGEVKEIDILLDPNVVSDIDAYIKKVQEEYDRNIENVPTTITTHIVNRKVKIGRKKTKEFLEQQYKGLCQICGFTFTKRKEKDKQYFELFDWFSEKITKQKVNIVQAGSSLSLCARCHAGVKYGSFQTNLVDILKKLDVKSMSFDEFVSKISTTVENKDIPMCYDFIENDMHKIDIRLLNKEEFIFYTEEHFMHLFVMLRSRGEL